VLDDNSPSTTKRGQPAGAKGGPQRRSGAWPPGGQHGSEPWGTPRNEPERPEAWGAPGDDTFGDADDDWPRDDVMDPSGRKLGLDGFGSSAFDSNGDSDTFGDTGDDTFGDLGGDTFGMDSGFGGGFDSYGFSDTVDTSSCGCFPKKEELLDMDLLARHLYDLLRREAFVERERLGIV